MRIAIFGTGAVGGFFGGKLAQAGEDVTFIARGDHLVALQSDGLRVESIDDDFSVQPAQATDDPATVGEVDYVLVCTKTWHVPAAAEAMKPMVGPDTLIIPLLNGIDAPDQLAVVFDAAHVGGGLCRIFAERMGPGFIQHRSARPYVAFGERDNQSSERTQKLFEAFEKAGVWVELPDDIEAAMWEKWLLVSSLGGVGSISRMPVGIMRTQPETRQMLEGSMREFFAVGKALGVGIADDIVENRLAYIETLGAASRPSMMRDIVAGRPSEFEAQIGALVRRGEKAGVPTPINSTIYAALLPSERLARGELELPG